MFRHKIYSVIVVLTCIVLFASSCSTYTPRDDNSEEVVPSLKISGNYAGCGIGAFLEDGDPTNAQMTAYESLISREVSVVMWFKDFTCSFPTSSCETVYAHGSIPMITWEPWRWGESSPNFPLTGIIAGNYDTYIQTFALAAKSWGKPFFLRFAHEMNGNWYPWDGSHNSSSSANYIAAWRRIYATFEALGVTNATWVWCSNNNDYPSSTWNTAESYYPGDSYVDWIGIDGYSYQNMATEDFDNIFQGAYDNLSSLHPLKPIIIGEMSVSTQDAHLDKASWISNTFNSISSGSYPNLKCYVWFNKTKYEGVWKYFRIEASETNAVQAIRNSMSNPYYLSTIH